MDDRFIETVPRELPKDFVIEKQRERERELDSCFHNNTDIIKERK